MSIKQIQINMMQRRELDFLDTGSVLRPRVLRPQLLRTNNREGSDSVLYGGKG